MGELFTSDGKQTSNLQSPHKAGKDCDTLGALRNAKSIPKKWARISP